MTIFRNHRSTGSLEKANRRGGTVKRASKFDRAVRREQLAYEAWGLIGSEGRELGSLSDGLGA